ncbi:MAG: PspA/IM30 family protein [Bryobacteraceae bacterium]
MGFFSDIFNRAGRVARGQASEGMSAVEDATFDATVRQTVADMRTELNKAVNASAVAMSNYNRLDAEYQKYVRQAQEWKDRAGQALDANNEDLARKALAKKAECDQQVASMQTSVDQARKASDTLKSQVMELKRKIDEAERTATTLVARFAALNRFEETVSKEEAKAQAFNQLAAAGKDDDLEKEFAALGSHGVDDDLAALKRERQLKAPSIPLSLPAPGDKVGGQASGQ